jgi:hypothetical protein
MAGATNVSLTLTNVQTTNAGNYSVVVTNVAGSVTSSNALLTVFSALTITITSPTNNQLFITSPLNIPLAAATSDSGGAVTNVQFLNGTNFLGNGSAGTNNTWSLLWLDVAAGNYTLTAMATDNTGNTATSSVSITVNAMPVVSILSPTNLQSYLPITNVTLLAGAYDPDGTITKVQLFTATNSCFTNLIGTATWVGGAGTNYSLTWSNLPAGVYPVIAVATDNRGASHSSPIRIFRVNPANPSLRW